jgi:large subunit ribosomal protein L25
MKVKIKADTREIGKKSDLNELRRKGFIPGIIYGEGKEGKKISLDKITFQKLYKKHIGEMVFYEIITGDDTYDTIIKDRQFHPVTQEVLHIDFLEIHKGKQITVNVPFKFEGEAKGVAEGGLLEILLRELEVSCLPKDIPDDIVIDVSDLEINDTIHLDQVELVNLETRLSEDTPIVAVRPPKKEEEIEVPEVEGEEAEEAGEAEEDTEKSEGQEEETKE